MGAVCSCVGEQSDIIPTNSLGDSEIGSRSQSTCFYAVVSSETNNQLQLVPTNATTKKTTESDDSNYDLFGEDTESEEDDNLRGVSNVVYRQE